MHVQQFVMAYGVEQDRLRALLPEGLTSLRPVLRLNAEIRDGRSACLEFNTAVERQDFRGWRNIAHWEDVPFTAEGGERPLPPALPAPALHGRRHPGRLPRRAGQRRLPLSRRDPGAPPPGAGDGSQGVLQLHLRLGLRHSRRSWPEPRQDPPRHPHGAEDRLPPPGPDGGKRRRHPLRSGPGRLPGSLPALSAAPFRKKAGKLRPRHHTRRVRRP